MFAKCDIRKFNQFPHEYKFVVEFVLIFFFTNIFFILVEDSPFDRQGFAHFSGKAFDSIKGLVVIVVE